MTVTDLTQVHGVLKRELNKNSLDTVLTEKQLAVVRKLCFEMVSLGFSLGKHGQVNFNIIKD